MARFTGGWVKLHRKLLGNSTFEDPVTLALFVRLLLMAVREEQSTGPRGRFKKLQPGQVICSSIELAETLGVPRLNIKRRLERLASEQVIEQQADNQGRIITILNWDEYQKNEKHDEQQSEQQADSDVNSKRTAKRTRNGEGKKEEDKNIDTSPGQVLDEKTPKKLSYKFDPVDQKAAIYFHAKIKEANPQARVIDRANLDAWSNEVRLMRESDGLTHNDIGATMDFVLHDPFWSTVVQSVANLRSNWDKITAKMNAPERGGFR